VAFEALNKYFRKKDEQIDPQRVVDFSSVETAEDVINAVSPLKK
jgi:hypothetical protein